MPKQIIFFLLSLLLLPSCDSSTLMHSYQSLEDNCWERTDTVSFILPVLTTDDNCSVLIGLRVTDNFPYEMLIMEVEQKYQNPFAHRVDTLYYQLTNQNGDFIEKGLNYFQFETKSLPLDLRKGQTGEIRVRHLMRREVLPGIMDVGIHVVR